MKPIVSVILTTKNAAERLDSICTALAKQRTRLPYEVHVVDRQSRDHTYSKARRIARNQKDFFVWKSPSVGAPAARNRGAKKARGKVLLFLDADTLPELTWLQRLAEPLLKPKSYPLAAVAGRTLPAQKHPEKKNLWERYLAERQANWEEERWRPFPAFLPWAPSNNLAVQAEVFRALGGFEEKWKKNASAVDFCWRLVLCGFVLGYQPEARTQLLRRHSLRSLLRQREHNAFDSQSLLQTYGRQLRLPALSARKERALTHGRRLLSLVQSTRNLPQAGYRSVDLLLLASTVKGSMLAQMLRVKANPRLHGTRKGQTPETLLRKLPRGYAHLHRYGWAYWKNPAEIQKDGDLLLFRPRRGERYCLAAAAWTVWQVKSEGGQSEDAAAALGHDEHDPVALRDIDEITLDLHTKRMLPH